MSISVSSVSSDVEYLCDMYSIRFICEIRCIANLLVDSKLNECELTYIIVNIAKISVGNRL